MFWNGYWSGYSCFFPWGMLMIPIFFIAMCGLMCFLWRRGAPFAWCCDSRGWRGSDLAAENRRLRQELEDIKAKSSDKSDKKEV